MFSLGITSFFRPNDRIKTTVYTITVILCLQTICNCVLLTIDRYIRSLNLSPHTNSTGLYDENNFNRLFQIGNDSSDEKCPPRDNDTVWSPDQPEDDVVLRKNVANSFPALIMIYLFGFLLPLLGKRFVLLVPMVGICIQFIICLMIIYLKLGTYWWYFGAFVLGVLGNSGVINLIICLIIVDITTKNSRSFCFVCFYALTMGLQGLTIFIFFYFTQWHGYVGLFWFGLILQLISIGTVFRFLDLGSGNYNSMNDTYRYALSCDIFTIFCGNSRLTRTKKNNILLTLIAYGFYALANSAVATFILALAIYPICWSSEMIVVYSLIMNVSTAILSLLGYHILARIIHADDTLICAISHVFSFTSALWTAFAQYKWQLFANSAFYSFAGYQNPLTLSMLSKWLNPYEINIAFIFVTEINQLIMSYGNAFFQWLYTRTTGQHKYLTLFLAAGFSVIPFILNVYLYIVRRRRFHSVLISSDETSPLLVNDDDDDNVDSSEVDAQNPSESTTTDTDPPTNVPLFSIGKVTLSLIIAAPPRPTNETIPSVQTTHNDNIETYNNNLIAL